jgi:hypothetical protein
MRNVTVALLLALLLACGGGSGSTTTGPGLGNAALQDLAQQILDECAAGTLQEWIDLLSSFQSLLDPEATEQPTFTVTGLDIVQAQLEWALDVDNDGTVDVTGSVGFTDAAGDPTIPFDLTAFLALLNGDLDGLSGLLGAAADGTVVRLEFTGETIVNVDGFVSVALMGGVAESMTAEGTLDSGSCTGTYDIDGTDFDSLGGTYPTASFNALIQGAGGKLTGTVTLDGTSIARLVVNLNDGAEVYTFDLDLATGEVTAVT